MDKNYEWDSFTNADDLALQPSKTENLLDSRASAGVSGDFAVLSADIDPRLNQREQTSISALVAYVAFTKKIGEDSVLQMLCGRFRAKAIDGIHGADYDDAIRFLVDFCDSQAAFN